MSSGGIVQLGYLQLAVGELDWWRRFAEHVGFAVSDEQAGELRLRTDSERDFRIVLQQQQERSGATAIGWELAGPEALQALRARLAARGFVVEDVPQHELNRRRVEGMAVVHDPDGLRNELYWGANSALRKPFVSPHGTRFQSGACGNGHLTMAVGNAQATLAFYMDGLGLRLSDAAWMEAHNRVYFLRCNARHHSYAFAQMPGRAPGTVHVMSDLDSLDTLGEVRDRLLDAGFTLNRDLGSHPLDGVVSLYVATPDGFDMELACGTRFIDEDRWETDKFNRSGRPWGHRKPLPTKDRR